MSEFNKAFRAARAAGKKTFSFNSKSYTTKLKSEGKSPAKSPSSQAATSGPPKTDIQRAVDSAPAKPAPKPAVADSKPAPVQGPKPVKAVGIARATSPIARAAAKAANAPYTPAPVTAGTAPRMAKNTAKADKPGPKPEGVWYAKKGSAISKAAARRANKPS